MNQVMEATGSLFQNPNGYWAGRSLSQALIPSKTQSSQPSFASQPSRVSSYYTQQSSMDFSQSRSTLSQKHIPQSQMDMSQKSIIVDMSQSIRASARKNRGCKVPTTIYLTLRVDFNKSMAHDELPLALKLGDYCMTSPVPVISGNGKSARGSASCATNDMKRNLSSRL